MVKFIRKYFRALTKLIIYRPLQTACNALVLGTSKIQARSVLKAYIRDWVLCIPKGIRGLQAV